MRADLVVEAGSWLFTYLAHSTLLLGGAWLLCRRRVAAPAQRDLVWKLALIGGLATASLQVFSGVEPLGGALTLEPGAPVEVGSTLSGPSPEGAWGGRLLESSAATPA